jgi:thiaminase
VTVTAAQIERAERLVESLHDEVRGFVADVEQGPFVRGVLDGSCPIEGVRFFVEQTYHLVMNDMGNLSLYVANARNEEEVDFFLFMTVAEKLMLDSLYLLIDAIGIDRQELYASEPHIAISFRTNYFTRLALYHLPGEVALAILINFPIWAGGARRVSEGMKQHYGLGRPVEGTDLLDTDVLDRFTKATQGFIDMATRIVAADLVDDEAERRMRRVAKLAAEYEAMVWPGYHEQGLKRAGR